MTGPAPVRDVLAAATAAALLSGVPSTAHAMATGRDPLAAARAAGTLVLPASSSPPVLLVAGAVAHAGISVLWTAVLSVVLPPRHAAACGAVAGLAIAALDLGVVGRRLPAIRSLPFAPQLADHVAFGAIAGAVLEQRRAYARRHVAPEGHLHRLR